MNILRLVKVSFDNLENRVSDAIVREHLCTFVDSPEETAYHKCAVYVSQLPKHSFYLGHDREVYPKYEITEEYAN